MYPLWPDTAESIHQPHCPMLTALYFSLSHRLRSTMVETMSYFVMSRGLREALAKLSFTESQTGPEPCPLRAHGVVGGLTA